MNAAFHQMSDAFAKKLAGASSGRCQLHPGGDGACWSMQGVIEHLVLTYRGTVLQTEKYCQRGVPTEKRADWKQVAARILVVGMGIFPRGQESPEFVLPGRGDMAAMEGDALAALFHDELTRLDVQLRRCTEIFGDRPVAAHFRFGPLTAQQWRRFHLVHGRHHLAQLERIENRIAGG